MKKRDLISGLFWLVVGAIFCSGAWKYGLVHFKIPGPGLLPFLAGIVLIFLSLTLIFSRGDGAPGEEEVEPFFPERESRKKIWLGLGSLFFYVLALPVLGFMVTTFLFMMFLLKFVAPERWRFSVVSSFLTALSSYLVFHRWLSVQLPSGILGF